MPLVDNLQFTQLRNRAITANAVTARFAACVVGALVLVACTPQTTDQTAGAGNPAQSASAALGATPTAGPKWRDLTLEQQRILMPLTAIWDSLGPTSKGKWIAIAVNYAKRSPAEQQRLQERMAQWALLTPTERERARLNFAETKKLPHTERAADWEAYQSLSEEKKQALAKAGVAKPVGAAIALVPTSQDKLTPVPVTRRTPVSVDAAAAAARPNLNPKTLLPVPVPPEAVSAPVADPVPAANNAPSETGPTDKSLLLN